MVTVLQSLNHALHQLMNEDARVMVLGEDILDPYGGAFKVTKGLSDAHPARVLATPISEAAIVGLASGMAMRGLRPIAEIMFGDFLFLAGDQLVNHAAKFQWMYNDQVRVPIVVRTPMGARRGYGPTHSQSIEKHFMGVPGLWVVAPSVLAVPGDLLRQAAMMDAPVVFIESKTCYGRELVSGVAGMTETTIVDRESPFPTVLLKHDDVQADALLWCYGAMVPHALDAVAALKDREGLHVDLAVISQLSPIAASHIAQVLEATHPTVVAYVEEASVEHGWSAELLSRVDEKIASLGLGPVAHVRIGAAHTPIPSSRALEAAMLPGAGDIVARIVDCF